MTTTPSRDHRRYTILMTLLAFIIIAACMRLPIPGIDLISASLQLAQSGGMERLSLFALGTVPLFSLLALVELVRLMAPDLTERLGHAGWPRLLFGIAVLLLTALQAYGVLTAFVAMGLMADTLGAMVLGIAAFVGVSALLLWLNDAIRLPGLGSGIWLLMTIPMFSRVPREIVMSIQTIRSGIMPPWHLWTLAGAVVIAVAIVVALNRLLLATRRNDGMRQDTPLSVLLWPPFLAGIATGYLMVAPIILLPASLEASPWLFTAMHTIVMSVLIPLFVYGYFRQLPVDRRADMKPILTVVALAQVLLCAGLGLLPLIVFAPAAPTGPALIVCVTVVLALGRVLVSDRREAQ
ncbi:hypothetical protein [Shinella sumterensis]|uniref:hypothetical protein n=1 Tax=Shinella sumterensis TaxID=1967501 RepID=UPI003F82B2FC